MRKKARGIRLAAVGLAAAFFLAAVPAAASAPKTMTGTAVRDYHGAPALMLEYSDGTSEPMDSLTYMTYVSQGGRQDYYKNMAENGTKAFAFMVTLADSSANFTSPVWTGVGEDGENIYDLSQIANRITAILQSCPDAKILLNLIGLPEDSRRLKFWNGSDHPAMVLINFQSGVVNNLPSLIQKGQITGIVIPSRDAKYDVPVPGDPLEAFKIRFVLVDKDNVNEYKDQLMI